MAAKLNRRQRRVLLRKLPDIQANPDRYLWAIDDTIISHDGRKIWGTYFWHDHNNGGTVYGHKLLVLGLVDCKRKVLIPVYWEILHSKKSLLPHKKGWEVATELLQSSVDFGFPKLTVVADSWFAGEDFFQFMQEMGFSFVVEIKSNRKVHSHGRRVDIAQRVDEFFSDRFRKKIFYRGKPKWATEASLVFKDSKMKLKTVAVANKKGLVHECFAYYVSDRLTWDASKIWGIARDRWTIEVQFRDLKQLFTLGEAAVRSKESVETAISVAVIGLTVIRLEQIDRVDTNENQNDRPTPAGAIVNEYKLASLKRSLSQLVTSQPMQKKFKLRLCKENFGKKPAEERKTTKNRRTSPANDVFGLSA